MRSIKIAPNRLSLVAAAGAKWGNKNNARNKTTCCFKKFLLKRLLKQEDQLIICRGLFDYSESLFVPENIQRFFIPVFYAAGRVADGYRAIAVVSL
jgi:hypothetical protein